MGRKRLRRGRGKGERREKERERGSSSIFVNVRRFCSRGEGITEGDVRGKCPTQVGTCMCCLSLTLPALNPFTVMPNDCCDRARSRANCRAVERINYIDTISKCDSTANKRVRLQLLVTLVRNYGYRPAYSDFGVFYRKMAKL